jgi:hypothetical protein
MHVTVDHNPDDPTLISRHFENPFNRLDDIRKRIKTSYLDITIKSPHVEKYLYELYYDMVFLKNLLVALGVFDDEVVSADYPNAAGLEKVVEAIRKKLLKANVDSPGSVN